MSQGWVDLLFCALRKMDFDVSHFFSKMTTYIGRNAMPDFEQPQVQYEWRWAGHCLYASYTIYLEYFGVLKSHCTAGLLYPLDHRFFERFLVTKTMLFQHYIGSFILKKCRSAYEGSIYRKWRRLPFQRAKNEWIRTFEHWTIWIRRNSAF